MKDQVLFSSKDKSKKLKCHLQFLFGPIRVKIHGCTINNSVINFIRETTGTE